MREQLIRKAETGLTEAVRAARIAGLTASSCSGCWTSSGRRGPMDNYLEVRGLSKSFAGFALRDISFTLRRATSWG